MQSAKTAPASDPKVETDGIFYTNRCKECGRALTKLEIIERIQQPKSLCPCGSNKFHSCNFKWWEELFLVRSWKMYFAIRRGELPPPPPKGWVAGLREKMIESLKSLDEGMDEEISMEEM